MAQPARTGLLRSIRHHNREASFLGIEQATISNPHRLRLAMRENDGSRRLQPTAAFRPDASPPHAAFGTVVAVGSVVIADFSAAEAPVAGFTTVRAD